MARVFGRSDRVASEMQKEIALILQREIRDPRFGLITINEVVISKDLAMAKIYFTVFNADDRNKQKHVKWLNELAPMIRHLLAKKMRLRHISELRFYYDDSFDTGMRVAELLKDVNQPDASPEENSDNS